VGLKTDMVKPGYKIGVFCFSAKHATNNDGTYMVNWTPGSVGMYNIHVTIDGFDSGL
jgi:hypothetical protein